MALYRAYQAGGGGGGAPSGPAGGSLSGTYPNPTFAGIDASVDKITQDLLLTWSPLGVSALPGATGNSPNLDGGAAASVYGGTVAINGGTP